MLEMKLRYFTEDESFPFFIQYGEHDTALEGHRHLDFSELVIVLSGTATHHVDEETYTISQGDVFVVNHHTTHSFEATQQLRICNIMFQPYKMIDDAWDICKSAGFHALFVLEPFFAKEHGFQSRLKLKTLEFDEIKTITKRMLDEYKERKMGWKTSMMAYFSQIIVELSRLYESQETVVETKVLGLARAIVYIQNHYNQEITVEVLASLSHYSTRHFIRVFRDMYQVTPMDYLITLRLKAACLKIKETNDLLSEIALSCGFNDSNYFSRLFHKRMGMSPRAYRKQQRTL